MIESPQTSFEHSHALMLSAEKRFRHKRYRRFAECRAPVHEAKNKIHLFPAPTRAHGHAFESLFKHLGFQFKALPPEDEASQRIGKMYVNRGQCAPVIYLTGNLIKFLMELRETGMTDQEIVDTYVFSMIKTSGGACRLPVYEEEYRKALAAIGLGNLCIEIIELGATGPHAGYLARNKKFMQALFDGVMIGDMINDIERRIRPYEINPGETDRAVAAFFNDLECACSSTVPARIGVVLRTARRRFEAIPLNLAQCKPKVNIIGEFYVASTEGHCTGDMFRWLESQGAEVFVRPITTYLLHKLWRRRLKAYQVHCAQRHTSMGAHVQFFFRQVRRILLFRMLVARYNRFASCLGNYCYPLRDIDGMAKIAGELYDPAFFSGEGFMEIAEHIMNIRHKEADMVLSLKPFTCMPSVCSDAIQVKVENQQRQSIFLAIEMNGDGLINARSRVQNKLHDAQQKVYSEMENLCSQRNLTLENAHLRVANAYSSIRALRHGKRQFFASTFINLLYRCNTAS